MWFNSALIYQYELDDNQIDLHALLSQNALKPCPPHARFIYGWSTPTFPEQWTHDIAGSSLICLGKEERVLPRSVITRTLNERIQQIEMQRGYPVKRAEKKQWAEELEFELLPKAFCIQKRLFAILDLVDKRVIINTTSTTQAEQLLSLLRKSVPTLHLKPLHYPENMAETLTQWLLQPNTLPANLELASDCILFSRDHEKTRFNCKGCELPSEEINTLLKQGLAVAELSLIWNERILFTLTHDFTFKRIKTLALLEHDVEEIRDLDDEAQQQDAALLLLSGELRALFHDVLTALHVENP